MSNIYHVRQVDRYRDARSRLDFQAQRDADAKAEENEFWHNYADSIVRIMPTGRIAANRQFWDELQARRKARFDFQTQRDAAAKADDSEFWHKYADAIDLSARRIAPR